MIYLRLQRIEAAIADDSKPADYLTRLKAVASDVNKTHVVLSDKAYEDFAIANKTQAPLTYLVNRAAAKKAKSTADKPGTALTPSPSKHESVGLRGRSQFEQTGSDNWALLHRSKPDRVWLRQFTNNIPCGACKQHWQQLLRKLPPDYSSDEAWFAWGVAAHNEVNRRLGKPLVDLEQAKRIWRPVPVVKRTPETNRIIGGMENRYLNKACFIVAGGPSLATIDLATLHQPGILLFGMNNSPAIIRPHLWTCGDRPDNFLGSIWMDPAVTKFCPSDRWKQRLYDSAHRIYLDATPQTCANVIRYHKSSSLSASGDNYLKGDKVIWGRNNADRCVLLLAIRIAYALGFGRVYLLGVDWSMDGQKQYAFHENKDTGAQKHNNHLYRKAGQMLADVKPYLERGGMKIFNATPGSQLKVFDRIDFQKAVEQCQAINLQGIDPAMEQTEGMYK